MTVKRSTPSSETEGLNRMKKVIE